MRGQTVQRLLGYNLPEFSSQIVAGTGGKEQRIRRTIGSSAAAEINGPELVDVNDLASCVLNGAHEGARIGIKRVNGAGVGVV